MEEDERFFEEEERTASCALSLSKAGMGKVSSCC
jgi:hypothetical protein